MIRRREIIAATLVSGAVLASPAQACRAPAAKDRQGYARTVDKLFADWWRRDFEAFQTAFRHPAVPDPFDARAIFEAHFAKAEQRFRGVLLFNGASAIVQVITPQGPDYEHGICGGYAGSHLFLVKFYPGLETPVAEKVDYVDHDLLAEGEWKKPNAGAATP